MKISEFDYELPGELIAQQPLPERDSSRMLVLHRAERRWEDRTFRDLPSYLHPGDCLVLNESRVLPSRLYGHRAGHTGHIEVLLLHPVSGDSRTWQALVRPGRKMRTGDRLEFSPILHGTILGRGEHGERTVQLECDGDVYDAIEQTGHIPLPPYIKRADNPADRERYQTVFARERGSVAAPTAGLHYTIEENVLHSERYSITSETWSRIESAKRVLAVGTTSVRTIESAACTGKLSGDTQLFIYPGAKFHKVGAMLTNFHLPRTSLLILVCAFSGKDFALAAYRHAVEQRYRFFSYGDCVLII